MYQVNANAVAKMRERWFCNHQLSCLNNNTVRIVFKSRIRLYIDMASPARATWCCRSSKRGLSTLSMKQTRCLRNYYLYCQTHFVNHFAIEVQSMDDIEEYLLGSISYRKLDATADTPQQSTFFYVDFILAMEFRSDGAIFLLDSGKDLMYYLGSQLLSEMFVPFMKLFCSIQIYKKHTGRRRRNIVRVIIKCNAIYEVVPHIWCISISIAVTP